MSDYQTNAIETQINIMVADKVQREISRLEGEYREKIRRDVEKDIRIDLIRAAGILGNLKPSETTAKEIMAVLKDLDRLSGLSMNDLERGACHHTRDTLIAVLSRVLLPVNDWKKTFGEAHRYV